MKATDRKQALANYRQRKVEAGIYAVRCAVSGEVWVGSAPDLSTIGNRHWFTLRTGGHPQRSLQQAWQNHGEAAFELEVIERLDEDLSVMARDVQLKQRLAHWLAQLQAVRI